MSKGIEQDVAFIQALAQLIRDSDLTEIEVEREYGEDDELKVRLSRASAAPAAPVYVTGPQMTGHQMAGHQMQAPPMHHQPHAPQYQPAQPGPAAVGAAGAAGAGEGPDLTNAVTSPMVGTAYLAAEPGSDPFVSVGDQVAEGQTILIIEAMKTMNQIPAPRGGRVRAILVENAEPVEFGEPLMIIE